MTDTRGWVANCRRKYHHLLHGGTLRPVDLEHICADAERAADRIAELEGDLSVLRLQLGARVCSECPAKGRVAELEAMLQSREEFLREITKSAGYYVGEAYTAAALVARLRDGDR